jgi:hypothetical protein
VTLDGLSDTVTGVALDPGGLVIDVRRRCLLCWYSRSISDHNPVIGWGSLVTRLWMLLWPAGDLPIQDPTAAAGVIAALVRQTDRRD